MIKEWSRKIVSWQINKGILHNQDKEIYEYAYEVSIGQAANILITCFVAFSFQYYMVFLFMLAYIPLRTYAGGFHARSNERCMIFSAAILCAVCIVGKYVLIQRMIPVVILLEVLAVAVVLILSPVEDCNKPLNREEEKKYRKYAYVITFIEIMIAAAFYVLQKQEISKMIMITHIVMAGTLIMGSIKNRNIRKQV